MKQKRLIDRKIDRMSDKKTQREITREEYKYTITKRDIAT